MAEHANLDIDLHNYSSLEDYEKADEVVGKLLEPQRGWVAAFKSEAELVNFLEGEAPVYNPFGLVLKDIKDPEGNKVGVKERLILDGRRSRANDLANAAQRLALPRFSDPVQDALKLLHRLPRRLRRQLKLLLSWLIADY